MVILSGKTLTRGVAFVPEEASLTLEERGGSLQLTMGPDQPDVSVGTWLLDDSGPGKGIVWRIKTIQESDDTRTRTVTCEHIINTLKDKVIVDDIDQGDVTAEWAIKKALSYQSEWKLGTLSYNITKPFTFNGESVFDAIETVCTAMDDPVWTFDMSAKPFTLNIVKRSSAVQSELRVGRNLKTLKKTIDRTGMYTRLYPRGENDLELSEKYIEKNTDLYGVITKMETDQSQTTEAMLRVWAKDRLKRHCEPTVSIAIDGLELADATGESLDRLRIGTICRVPLPDLGAVIKEKITKLNWKKLISAPEEVTVTLCNTVTDLASFIKNESSSGTAAATKSSRSSAKKNKKDHAWFTDAEDHVNMTAEAILGKDASGKVNWSRVADLGVDGKGIHGRVTETENGLVTHQTKIEANEKAITLEAEDRSKGDEELSGRIKVAADDITAEVTRAKNEETQLRGALNVQADCVSLVTGVGDGKGLKYYATRDNFPATGSNKYLYMAVDTGKYYSWNGSKYVETSPNAKIKAAGIVSAINADGTSTTRILGTRVLVGGTLDSDSLPDWADTTSGLIAEKATIGQLNAVSARVGTLEADAITTATLKSKIASLDTVGMKAAQINTGGSMKMDGTAYIRFGSSPNFSDLDKDNVSMLTSDAVVDLDITLSGNVYTLKKKTTGNTATWTDVGTFSRATTLTGAWGGLNTADAGKFTVTASPQNTKYVEMITGTSIDGTPTLNSGSSRYVDAVIQVLAKKQGDSGSGNVVYQSTKSINAGAAYNAGYDAISAPSVAWNAVASDATGGPSGTASIASTTGGSARSTGISLTMSKTTFRPSGETSRHHCVEVKRGNSTVGRFDAQDIYTAGAGDVGVSSMTQSGGTMNVSLSNGVTDSKSISGYHPTGYSLYCSKKTTQGSGEFNYVFEATLGNDFDQGTTYNFYR